MKKKEIEIGDAVFLRGSPDYIMTVLDVDSMYSNSVICGYFDSQNYLRREVFRRDALLKSVRSYIDLAVLEPSDA